MSAHETISELISGVLDDHPDVPAEAVASTVIGHLPPDALREVVFPLVLSRVRTLLRNKTRSLEYEVDRAIADGVDPVAARRLLIAERFVLPDGRWVTWGEATAADHRLRAEWQRTTAAGLMADAERHEDAAAAIEAVVGATCLNDLLDASVGAAA